MFSQTVEYALRAMVYLATESPNAVTTSQIADGTKVPSAYLSKVLQSLSRSDLVRSQRGVKGGMSLARPPSEVSLLEVVNAVDPIERISECPLGIARHGTSLCPLHRRMDDTLADIESAFGNTMLENLLNQPGENFPLCEVPPVQPPTPAAKPSSPAEQTSPSEQTPPSEQTSPNPTSQAGPDASPQAE